MTPTNNNPLLRIDNLLVSIATQRGMVRAVNGLSLTLDRGKTMAIVGESGCGKSILCRSILGLLPGQAKISSKSNIRFNGTALTGLSEKGYNKIRAVDIAMVFQDSLSSLHPVMPVGVQTSEVLIHRLKMNSDRAGEKTVELLRSVGIPNPEKAVSCYPHQLSGGLRQRVAIAIAIAGNPKLLIADEPTTALDVTIQAGVLALLKKLQINHNMALILITHDLGVAAYNSDEIAVMYAGKIVEKAPVEALFSNTRMPYTKALMDAIPRIANPPHTRLFSLNGLPPDLMTYYSGCTFTPRCTKAGPKCFNSEPVLTADANPGHTYACWYPLGDPGK